MPKRTDINSVLILGAGPIVIGQACEFDYSGAQACKALKEDGFRVILVNSNPATIMTDPSLADATYIEPIQWQTVEKIIEKEKPDVIVNTMGYSNIDFCESNKNNTEKLHVETTERICNICESNGSKQIFLSSDYVFDGEKGDYSENDIPNPVNFYGLSKLKAEQLILKNPPDRRSGKFPALKLDVSG